MAFLEDDDAVRAFEAALSFVEQYSIGTSVFTSAPSASGAAGAAFSPSLASAPVDDIELLSPSLAPAFGGAYASPGEGSDTSMTSPSSPAFQLSSKPSARLELGLPATGQVSTKRKTVARGRKKSAGPKKPVTRGDPNRARNERKIELAYLREKVAQLELEMKALKLHPRTQTRAIRQHGEKTSVQTIKQDEGDDSTVSLYDPVQVPTVWKEVACRQRRRREKAERENVRLKLILENQIKMAKGLESLLQKRAKQQVVECTSLSQTKKSKYSQGRTLDFRADHRGNMYEGKVAKHLETPDTPDTIIEDFAKEFFADSARADFHAKQVLRRYVEEDREIVIWVASVVPLEFDDQRVKGLGFRHQGYAVTKRAKASTPNREFSLLQICSLVSPEKEDHTVYDPAAVRALTDFMLGTVAGNTTASQELIENVLMDQAVKM
ncbi:M96 mating-specific protein family [Phytophthora cinnamomi]|uniref:M96 mating-specific protein family n=1 Tax=Phytophthora cinnamomi TaxID=4785 RepID=UPI00355A27E7|nr:M96 mating-specific protein family [Phytophthora cinnamomi]